MWKVFIHHHFCKEKLMSGKKVLHLFQVDCFLIAKLTFNKEWSYLSLSVYSVHSAQQVKTEHVYPGMHHTGWKQKAPEPSWYSYLSSRRCIASHESRRFSSTYIRKSILKQQAKLLVSCFKRLGFDLPLNPRNQLHIGREGTFTFVVTTQEVKFINNTSASEQWWFLVRIIFPPPWFWLRPNLFIKIFNYSSTTA